MLRYSVHSSQVWLTLTDSDMHALIADLIDLLLFLLVPRAPGPDVCSRRVAWDTMPHADASGNFCAFSPSIRSRGSGADASPLLRSPLSRDSWSRCSLGVRLREEESLRYHAPVLRVLDIFGQIRCEQLRRRQMLVE